MRVNVKRSTLLGAMTALAIGVLGPAGSASAGVLVASGTNCPDQAFSQAFAPFGDGRSYTLVPNGGLEHGSAGWDLDGSAHVVSGNEPWQVNADGDDAALDLPSGSSAESPSLCVGLEHPTVRFFARRTKGGLLGLSTLAVSAVVHLNGGGKLAVPVGVVLGNGTWKPTPAFLYLGNALAILAGNSTPMSFRFTPLLGGEWQIDDVYVDPFRKA
jgi:hypothetical protein